MAQASRGRPSPSLPAEAGVARNEDYAQAGRPARAAGHVSANPFERPPAWTPSGPSRCQMPDMARTTHRQKPRRDSGSTCRWNGMNSLQGRLPRRRLKSGNEIIAFHRVILDRPSPITAGCRHWFRDGLCTTLERPLVSPGRAGMCARQSIDLANSLESLGRFGSVIWASVRTCDQLEYGKVGVFHPIL